MKNFEVKNNNTQETVTQKPARKVKKKTVAAIVLTSLVAVGALTVIGIFGSKKTSKMNEITADRLSAAINTVDVKQEMATPTSTNRSYQFFAPAQSGNSNSWNLVKGENFVDVSANYDTSAHVYKFDIKGKEKGTGDVELSYRVKDNKINTAKLRLTVDENMNVSVAH